MYGLAGIIFISGWVFFAVFLFKNLSGLSGKLQQAVVPGTAEIHLSQPGDYTIFYEHESVVRNRVYSTAQQVSGLECTLVSKTTGVVIPLTRSTTNSTYSISGRSGRSLLEFHVDQPGTYLLTAQYAEGQTGPEIVLAIGQGFVTGILTAVFGGLAIVFGGIGLAVAIAVYTAVMRHKAAQRA